MSKIVDVLRRATALIVSLPARVATARKAVVPFVTSALAVAALVLGADSTVVGAVAALATALGVYSVPNAV